MKKNRSKLLKGLTGALVATIAFSGLAIAAVPKELIYEGRMLSKTGEVLTDSYVLRFSFWKSADFVPSDLSAGSINETAPNYAGWQETSPITFNELGHFSVILGKTNSLASLNFEKYKFLQVEIKKASEPDSAYKLMDIDGDNGANATDRKTVASVPYARHADEASISNNANFMIDALDTKSNTGTGQVSLHFGNALNKMLSYDLDTKQFVFNDNLAVQGNIAVTGTVDGVDVSALGTTVNNLATGLQNLGGSETNTFILDTNDSGGPITLQFGNTLNESLTWDPTNSRFNISDDLNIDGNITLPGTVDGVDISDLKTLVDGHSTSISTLQTTIADHASQITSQSGSLNTITQTLANHTALLTQNGVEHTNLTNQISQLGAQITTQAGQINTLTTQVAANTNALNTLTDSVNTNTALLATHTSQINTLTNTLAAQGAQLADLTSKVNTNTADILTLTNQVNSNISDIATLKTKTDAQGLDIANLKTQVATHAVQLADHATQLATQANQIATLTADIATLKPIVAQNTANIATNTTDIATLKPVVAQNTANIATNTTDIATLKPAVAQNTANIADLKTRMNAVEAKNTAQDRQIAGITTLVGDGVYDSTNIISFGDSLTDAISKIDTFLGTTKSLAIHLPLGEAVIIPDGTNNKVNVYHASEAGINPHQFLKAVSTKATLQDIGMQIKVQLPKDLKKLTAFKMFYKADGTAAQSSFDVKMTDSAGNVAFSDTNQSNAAWTALNKTIGNSFTPTAGDYIYLTITARSMNSKAMMMGDMVLEYESSR